MVQSVDRDSYDKYKYVKSTIALQTCEHETEWIILYGFALFVQQFHFSCAPDPAASACK